MFIVLYSKSASNARLELALESQSSDVKCKPKLEPARLNLKLSCFLLRTSFAVLFDCGPDLLSQAVIFLEFFFVHQSKPIHIGIEAET